MIRDGRIPPPEEALTSFGAQPWRPLTEVHLSPQAPKLGDGFLTQSGSHAQA
jgi:hypothetical protein